MKTCKKLFGTDGIRGQANKFITADMALKIAEASAIVLGYKIKYNDILNSCFQSIDSYINNKKNKFKKPKVLIARDTRLSGDLIQSAFQAGLMSSGIDVYNIGVFTTPGLAYLTSINDDIDFGVMISASHNHAYDNGIKFFSHKGYKISNSIEQEIENIFYRCIKYHPIGDKIGKILLFYNPLLIYKNYLLSSNEDNKMFNFNQLKIVLDCANGSAAIVAKNVFEQTGAIVKVIGDNTNGISINDQFGVDNLDNLKNSVLINKYDLGIAYDGDADRCIAIDHLGKKVDGDQIMTILALYLKSKNKLRHNTLVATNMSNLGMQETLLKRKIYVETTHVGDKHIMEIINKKGYSLGGEQSGHIIQSNYSTTGDGLLTSLHLVNQLVCTGKSLSDLASQMKKFPQVLTNIFSLKKEQVCQDQEIKNEILKAQQQLGKKGRIVFRPSGTENLIRLLVESENFTLVKEISNHIICFINRKQKKF